MEFPNLCQQSQTLFFTTNANQKFLLHDNFDEKVTISSIVTIAGICSCMKSKTKIRRFFSGEMKCINFREEKNLDDLIIYSGQKVNANQKKKKKGFV